MISDKQPRIANSDYPANKPIAKIKLRCRANAFFVSFCAARNCGYGLARQVDGANAVVRRIYYVQRVVPYRNIVWLVKFCRSARSIGSARRAARKHGDSMVCAAGKVDRANAMVSAIGNVQGVSAYGQAGRAEKLRRSARSIGSACRAAGNRAYGTTRQVDGADKVIAGIGNIQRVAAYGDAFGVGKPRSRSRAIGIARSSTARKIAYPRSRSRRTYGNRADALIIPVGNVDGGALYGNAKRKAKSCRSIPRAVCVPRPS